MSFTVEELVGLTIGFYRRNFIEGLFLSSGIFSDPDIVMERLIAVAKILREREGFGGYIHLKAIPGCGDRLLKKAGLYADRLSANIELPTASSLSRLAPKKSGAEILGAMRFVGQAEAESKEDRRRQASGGNRFAPRFAPAGQSTQLVIGASPDDDRTILRLAGALYKRVGLRRVYYSAFVPVSRDPRLPDLNSPPLVREHRLYQADWLIRFYGFTPEEILAGEDANLSAELDPKTAWALKHPEFFPVDIASAEYDRLLRVPGIGVTGAGRIVSTRRSGGLYPDDLPKLGVVMKRAQYFLSHKGRPLVNIRFDSIKPHVVDQVAGSGSQGWAASIGPGNYQLEFSFS